MSDPKDQSSSPPGSTGPGVTPEIAQAQQEAAAAVGQMNQDMQGVQASADATADALTRLKRELAQVREHSENIKAAYEASAAAASTKAQVAAEEAQSVQQSTESLITAVEKAGNLNAVRQQARDAAAQEARSTGDTEGSIGRIITDLQKQIEYHSDILSKRREEQANLQAKLTAEKASAEAAGQGAGAAKQSAAAYAQALVSHREATAAIEQKIAALNKERTAQQRIKDKVGPIGDMVKQTLQSTMGITDYSNTLQGRLRTIKKHTVEWKHAQKEVQAAMAQTLSTNNLILNAAKGMSQGAMALAANEWKVAKSLDEAGKGFLRATGAGEKYKNAVFEIRQSNSDLIPSFEKASQLAQGLYSNMYRFSELTPKLQSDMVRFAAIMGTCWCFRWYYNRRVKYFY